MNIRNELIKEHSKKLSLKIAKYVGNDQNRFDDLIHLMLHDEYRIGQRSAWAVRFCVQNHPELIKPWLKKMIVNLNNTVHDSVKRNTVRLLQDIYIPPALRGSLTEICFRFLLSKEEPVAVKVFSMTVLCNIAKQHPELKNELKMIIEEMIPYGKPGIVSRGKKVLKELKAV